MSESLLQEYLYAELCKVESEIEDEIRAIRTKTALIFRLERLKALLVKKDVLQSLWRDLSSLGVFRGG